MGQLLVLGCATTFAMPPVGAVGYIPEPRGGGSTATIEQSVTGTSSVTVPSFSGAYVSWSSMTTSSSSGTFASASEALAPPFEFSAPAAVGLAPPSEASTYTSVSLAPPSTALASPAEDLATISAVSPTSTSLPRVAAAFCSVKQES